MPYIIISVLVMPFSVVMPAYAISQNDLNSVLNGTPFYDPAAVQCDSSSSSLVGSDNLQQIFNYFVSNGYTAPQAAGIVGNIEVESHGDPEIWEGDGKDYQTPPEPDSTTLGWGIVQWTPASKILNDAQSVGQPAYELSTQVSFLLNQLNGTAPNNNEQPAGNALKQTTTADQAAVAFMQDYERPSNDSATGTNAQVRSDDATQALILYGGSPANQAGITTTSNNTSSCSSGGAGGSIDGCAFGSSTGPFTTSSTAVTTFPKEISVTQMCQNVQDLVYNRSSSVYKQWLTSCNRPNDPNCAEGWCGLAVAIAWGYRYSGYNSAANPDTSLRPTSNLLAAKNAGVFHAGDLSPPVGALLFYRSISADGHVAVYLGNNMVMSSDVWGPGVIGVNPVDNSSDDGYLWIAPESTMLKWSPGYLGWAEPIFAGSQYQSS